MAAYLPIGYGYEGTAPSVGGYWPIGYGYQGVAPSQSGQTGIDPTPSGTPTAPPWNSFAVPYGYVSYCTDEDIAVRRPGDFWILCPEFQQIGKGVDGVFATGDPWVLQSASVDFHAVGLTSGHVVCLNGPKNVYRTSGDLFGVDAVTPGRVRLRRLGMPSTFGAPPGPAAGLAGVSFEIRTLGPQILDVSLDANNTFGIDANIPLNSPQQIYDPNRQLLRYVVLQVLLRQYSDETRSRDGDFHAKMKELQKEVPALREQLSVRWGPLGTSESPKNLFSTRYFA